MDQLTKFDRALKDFSSVSGGVGKGRGIDGMLITKWDTVDDKVRTEIFEVRYFLDTIRYIIGWCCIIDDLCYWTAYIFRWLRTGK